MEVSIIWRGEQLYLPRCSISVAWNMVKTFKISEHLSVGSPMVYRMSSYEFCTNTTMYGLPNLQNHANNFPSTCSMRTFNCLLEGGWMSNAWGLQNIYG